MTITGWTNWDDQRYKMMMRCDDYFEAIKLVREEIKKNDYYFSGEYHQNGEYGIPIIDDKYKLCLSQRRWGMIMAEAHGLDNSDGLAYCIYAWDGSYGQKFNPPQ